MGHYTFYSIYPRATAIPDPIGMLWAFGVLCEIGIFLLMPRCSKRVDLRRVLIASLVLAVLRWLLTGCSRNLPSSSPRRLHGSSTFHTSAMQFVHRILPAVTRIAVRRCTSVSFGIGGAVGSL